MKQAGRFIFILLLACGLSACKKKFTGQVIPPSPYFPVYPGSHWEYSNGGSITVNDQYQTDCEGKLALPFITCNNVFGNSWFYVKGYDMRNSNCDGYYDGFVREYKTQMTSSGQHYQGHYTVKDVINTDTSITIGVNTYNQVIAVKTYDGSNPYGSLLWGEMLFYARDIGLIRSDRLYCHFDSLGHFHADSTGVNYFLTGSHVLKPN